MSLKAKLEAIIYATEEPVTLNELASLLKDPVLAELRAEEEARLALNVTIFEGRQPAEDQDEDSPSFSEAPESETPEAQPNVESQIEAVSVGSAIAEATGDGAATQAGVGIESKKPDQTEEKEQLKAVKTYLSSLLDQLIVEYGSADRGMEIRQIAGGYRMTTKPEHHDVVVSFAKSLKPPVRLSLQALETLAVIAYKQPVTVPEISEIRGVDSAGVIATLLDRKLITTAGRKQVIGRPILYKTTKEFLLRFGLKDVGELPSVEEFEKLGEPQAELFATPAEGTEQAPATDTAAEAPPIEPEPVTEAVPDPGHHLGEEATMPADGTYATEAEPEKSPERS